MAFATSSAAFGIKSSAPANASIFGTSNATKPQGSIFGTPQPQQQQQQSGFGGTLGQPPAQTSIFGNSLQPQQQQQQQQPQTSLFGQPQQQQQPQTNLFGQPQQQQQQQQQQQPQTSLFGQPLGQPQQQQQPNAFGGPSLFGNATNNNQSTTLFGSTLNSQPQGQQQQQQPTLWGANSTSNPLQAQPTLPAGSSGFGNFPSGSTTSLFGQKPPQQQQQQSFGLSSQPSGPPPFTKATKFNDLPDELKRGLENIDSYIQGRVQVSAELRQRKLGEEATKGQDSIRGVHKEFITTSSAIQSDSALTRDLKSRVDQALQDTIIATRIVDGFKNPQQSGQYLKNYASFPFEFFTRVTEQMKARLAWYKSTIEQIERKLTSSAGQAQYTPQAISATLQAQHATFIALASKTAALDAELQKIKALYTQLWRAKTGSMRDPFNDLDRGSGGDFGLGSLNVA